MEAVLVEIKNEFFKLYDRVLDNKKPSAVFRDESILILKVLTFLYKKKKGKNKRHIVFEDSNVTCHTTQGRYFAKRYYTHYNIYKKISIKTFEKVREVFGVIDYNIIATKVLFVNDRRLHIENYNMQFYLRLHLRLRSDKNIDELDYCFSELKIAEHNLLYVAEKLKSE